MKNVGSPNRARKLIDSFAFWNYFRLLQTMALGYDSVLRTVWGSEHPKATENRIIRNSSFIHGVKCFTTSSTLLRVFRKIFKVHELIEDGVGEKLGLY